MTSSNRQHLAAGSKGSIVVERCQVCNSAELEPLIFMGFLPPVNTMPTIGTRPTEQSAYPAQVLRCGRCQLVQLGLIVDPAILFPPSYPYTSGTTKILRDNFANLYAEVQTYYPLAPGDLAVDIGSNDGTLLSNFKKGGYRVLGIEPTNAGLLAIAAGIPTDITFFDRSAAKRAVDKHGRARVVTAANVFAHIEDIHEIVDCILEVLAEDGVFISESHYLLSLVETLQYDTIYHEHLRYYSLTSLKYLLSMHGFDTIHAQPIPTHGGSIRVYAARKGRYSVRESIAAVLKAEAEQLTASRLLAFRARVVDSKLALHALLWEIKANRQSIYAVGAPSRASTLVNYVGLDDGILDCVLEIKGSHKIGKYLPGTLIPVLEETKLYEDQPPYVLLLSWHIAEELIANLTRQGYKGKFIIPLPQPRVVSKV